MKRQKSSHIHFRVCNALTLKRCKKLVMNFTTNSYHNTHYVLSSDVHYFCSDPHSIVQVELDPEKQLKMKMDFSQESKHFSQPDD